MPWYQIIWNYDDEDGNVAHLAEHGVTPEEAEHVLMHPASEDESRSSDRRICFGRTKEGRALAVLYEMVDEVTIYPVTAYDVE